MADNVSVKSDPAGNVQPDKQTSSDRIDGIVASIMSLGAIASVAPPPCDYSKSLFFVG